MGKKENIIVVLGNHDLWNLGRKRKNKHKLADIIVEYRKLFQQLGIQFLQNELLIIKRKGLYCFLFFDFKQGKFYFLKGGAKRAIKEQNQRYFLDRMVIYKEAMSAILKDYHKALKYVSNIVKSIGGEGKIHGNIVDIDFNNHINVNPFDGSIKAYSALSKGDRVEYSSVEELLKEERKDLYLTYKKMYLENKNTVQVFTNSKQEANDAARHILGDTTMYGPSNVFRSWQYMFDVNVIREWNEEMVEKVIAAYQSKGTFMLEEK